MQCTQNLGLVLQLLVDDLEDLEDLQKGKQAAGNPTDLELAIAMTKNEIVAAQTSIDDENLAINTSTAIATDQNILIAIRHAERVAEQDRRYAIALGGDGGQDVPRVWFMTDRS